MFRIVQEALTNAVRHSRAARSTVSVANGEGLAVTIEDDGQGFEPDARTVVADVSASPRCGNVLRSSGPSDHRLVARGGAPFVSRSRREQVGEGDDRR